jgi:hypothetical protein
MREPANAASDLAFAAVALYQIRCAFMDWSISSPSSTRTKRYAAENLLINYPLLSFASGIINLFHALGTCMNHSCRCTFGHRMDVVGMCACTLWLVYFQSMRLASLRFWPSSPSNGHANGSASIALLSPATSSSASVEGTKVYPSSYGHVMIVAFVCAYLPLMYAIWLWADIPYSNMAWQQREQTLLVSILIGVMVLTIIYRNVSRQRLPSVTSHDTPFIIAFVCLLGGILLHKADLHRIWCIPHSALQGHAVWHIATAFSLHSIYIHFRSEHWPLTKRS